MNDFRYFDFPELDFVRSVLKTSAPKLKLSAGRFDELSNDLPSGFIRVVWSGSEGSAGLPSYFIADQKTLKSVLGRLLALPGGINPITSVIRAWDVEDLRVLASVNHFDSLSNVAAGFVGLIIGELTHVLGEVDLRHAGLDLVKRTLTFTCSQVARHGYDGSVIPVIVRRWLEISQMSGNSRDSVTAYAAARFSAFLISMTRELNEEMSAATLAHIINSWTDAAGDRQKEILSATAIVEDAIFAVRSSSREVRADVVEAALKEIQKINGTELQSGFLISLIDPGSLDFFDYAGRYDSGSGGVQLAYLMCAGILGGASTFGKNHGFGMNVCVNGFKNASYSPDISIAEFELLASISGVGDVGFRTKNPSSAEVEIFPLVCGVFSKRGRGKRGGEENVASELAALRERVAFARQAIDAAYGALGGQIYEYEEKKSTAARRAKK